MPGISHDSESAYASFSGVDISTTESLDFFGGGDATVPSGAHSVSVICQPSSDAHIEVVFYETADSTTEIARITDASNGDLATTGGEVITSDVVLMSPYISVEYYDDSGGSNQASGSARIS